MSRKRMINFQLNPDPKIRQRIKLKPYNGQRIRFIGILQKINHNAVRYAHKYNVLFIDVHAVEDLTTHQLINIDLEHVHCQVDNGTLINYEGSYLSFSAEIINYQSKDQNDVYETRYGLTNLIIENSYSLVKDTNQVNSRYVNKLTLYQNTLIRKIIPLLNQNYADKKIYSFDKIKRNILQTKEINQRTIILVAALKQLFNNKNLSKPNIFFNAKNIKKMSPKVKKQYNKEINQLNKRIEELTASNEKLVVKNQKLILQQQKQLNKNTLMSLNIFQVIYQYLKMKHQLKKNKRNHAQINVDKVDIKTMESQKKEDETNHEDASQESLQNLKNLFNADRIK